MNELYSHILGSIIDLDKRDFQVPRGDRIAVANAYLELDDDAEPEAETPNTFDTFESL